MTKLTKYERISLMNQFEILNNQNGNGDYDRHVKVLQQGLEFCYDEVIFDYLDEPKPENIGHFVNQVLKLYTLAISSYDNLKENEQTEELKQKVKFNGFDKGGSTFSGSCADYAEYQMFTLNKFVVVQNHLKESLDSHGFSTDTNTLKRYISAKEEIMQNKSSYSDPLTKEELEKIFK